MNATPSKTVSLLGFGEVSAGIAKALLEHGYEVIAFDVRLDAAARRLADAGLTESVRISELKEVAAGDLVISAVTPAAALGLVQQLQELGVGRGALLDINSTGPDEKRKMVPLAREAGFTSFTDGTIGGGGFRLEPGPVFHLAGPQWALWAEILGGVGFRTDMLGDTADDIGKAALFKMIRTVFTKGYEALIVESMSVAWRGGVLDSIIGSLEATFDHLSFGEQARLLSTGHVSHAGRRLIEVQMARAATADLIPGETFVMASGTESRYRLSSERLGDRYGKTEPTDLVSALELLGP